MNKQELWFAFKMDINDIWHNDYANYIRTGELWFAFKMDINDIWHNARQFTPFGYWVVVCFQNGH